MELRILRINQSFSNGPADDSTGPHDSLKPLLDIVDESTKSDVVKYRFLGDARRCLLGRLLVRFVLSERCQLPFQSFSFEKTERDRPYAYHPSLLPNAFSFDYNTSHDSNLTVVGTLPRSGADDRIGIDVMRIRNPWDGTTVDEFVEGIGEQLTAKERSIIDSLADDSSKLGHSLALWTLKESYVKATGEGLHCDLSRLNFALDLTSQEEIIGQGAFDGSNLEGWSFDLIELGEEDGQYYIAIARRGVEEGKGEVRRWTSKPDWVRFVKFEEVIARARNEDDP
ncbi:hypothetical protein JCM5353_000797 [Sporobolomyces roseus]